MIQRPRGKERNLSGRRVQLRGDLKQALIPQDKYRPFPTIQTAVPGRACARRPGPPSLQVGKNISATMAGHAGHCLSGIRQERKQDRLREHPQRSHAGPTGSRLCRVRRKQRAAFSTTSPTVCGPPVRRASGVCRPTSTFRKPTWDFRIPRDPIVDLFAAQTSALLASTVYVLDINTRYGFSAHSRASLFRNRASHPRTTSGPELHVDGPARRQAASRSSLDRSPTRQGAAGK